MHNEDLSGGRGPSGCPQRRGGDPSSGHGSTAACPFNGWAFGARPTDSRVLICNAPFRSNRRHRGDHVAIGALAVAYPLLWLGNARLLAGSGVIGQRNLVGKTTIVQTPDLGRLLIATVVYSKNSTPQRALYVFSQSGQALMTLNTRAWGDEAIAKVVDATGKSLEYLDAPISSREFKAEFPNAVSWTALHPNLLDGGIVIVALVLAIGIPVAWDLLSKQ